MIQGGLPLRMEGRIVEMMGWYDGSGNGNE